MKKVFLILILLFSCLPTSIHAQDTPDLYSQQAIVMEVDTKRILFEKNAYERGYPASLTKMLTLQIALEYGNLEDDVFIDQESIDSLDKNSSFVPFYAGEHISLSDLLYGMTIASGNETCNVLGKHLYGSVDILVQVMNERLTSIGATNTHFNNPHGLYRQEHYSTAYDMALIMNEGIKDERFVHYLSTTEHIIEQTDQHRYHDIKTHNELIDPESDYYLDGIVCSKNGFTDRGRHTMAAYFKVQGMSFIIVTMNCQKKINRFDDIVTLYHYILSHYQSAMVPSSLDETLILPEHLQFENPENTVSFDTPYWTTLLDTETYPITSMVQFNTIETPLQQGDTVGTITFQQDDQQLILPLILETNIVEKPKKRFPLKECLLATASLLGLFMIYHLFSKKGRCA